MKRRDGRKRGWKFRLILAGAAGLLLTIAGGVVGLGRYWSLVNGPAATMTPDAIGFFEEGGSDWQWTTNRVWGAEWTDMVAVGGGLMPPGTAASFVAAGIPNEPPAEWARIRRLMVSHNAESHALVTRVGVGWPAPAFGSTYTDDKIIEGFDMGAVGLPALLYSVYPVQRFECSILPTRVRWAGFAADAGFWGALTFAGLSLPSFIGAARRRSRARRGACLACGYDLNGSAGVCPECGA